MAPAIILAAALMLAPSGHGVVFYSTADPAHNTSASGTIAETAWGYEGTWGSFLGTAIAPNFFITAKHVNGSVGNTFTYQGVGYTTTASYAAPAGVDLRIWQVAGTLPTWAPLYGNSDELGQSLVVIGRGTQRGGAVTVSSVTKGWTQGTADHVQRWGENIVSSTPTLSGADYLAAEFNAGAGSNEAHLTVGDSGGAVFLQDPVDSLWKLAGINYAVDGLWSYTGATGSGFRAAIFDGGGLYVGNDSSGWTYQSDLPVDIPSHFYSTRISSYRSWILSVIPEPQDYALVTALVLGAAVCWRRARRD